MAREAVMPELYRETEEGGKLSLKPERWRRVNRATAAMPRRKAPQTPI